MALLNIPGEDAWLKDFVHTEILIREIMQLTVKRRQYSMGHTEHASLSIQLRKHFPQADNQITSLLYSLDNSKDLTAGELERRFRLCEALQSDLKKATIEYNDGFRQDGPFTKVADLDTSAFGEEETDITRNVSTSELRESHRNVIEAQDDALDNLCTVIQSQKRIAKSIGTEVEEQDDLLLNIKEHMGNTQNSMEQETNNISTITKKTSTCGYWFAITILMVAIIIVALW